MSDCKSATNIGLFLRVQLLHCREHLNTLLSKEGGLQTSVSELEAGDGATASLGLVRSQLDRVRLEIAAKKNVELNIQVCNFVQLTM